MRDSSALTCANISDTALSKDGTMTSSIVERKAAKTGPRTLLATLVVSSCMDAGVKAVTRGVVDVVDVVDVVGVVGASSKFIFNCVK